MIVIRLLRSRFAPLQRPHRAGVDTVMTVPAPGLLKKRRWIVFDHGIDASSDKAEGRLVVAVSADSDAFTAEHAAMGIVVDTGMAGVNLRGSLNVGQGLGCETHL